MPQTFIPVTSLEGTHFTEALAATVGAGTPPFAASALYNLPGVPPTGPRRYYIRAITLITMENFGPEFNFFSSSAGGAGVNPALDFFLARWTFNKAAGEQVGGAGLWRYYIDGLAIPYWDQDTINTGTPPTMHVILQNTDVTAKSAGAAGQIQATFWLEPVERG